MSRSRFIKTLACPTATQVLEASGGYTQFLSHGQFVELWHFGEDGEVLLLAEDRELFIDREAHPAFMSPAFANEAWDASFDD